MRIGKPLKSNDNGFSFVKVVDISEDLSDETLDKIIKQSDDGSSCNTFGDETMNKIDNIIKQYDDGSVCNTIKDETINKIDNILKHYVELNCAVDKIENHKRFTKPRNLKALKN